MPQPVAPARLGPWAVRSRVAMDVAKSGDSAELHARCQIRKKSQTLTFFPAWILPSASPPRKARPRARTVSKPALPKILTLRRKGAKRDNEGGRPLLGRDGAELPGGCQAGPKKVTAQEGRVQGSGFRPDFTARAVARLGRGYLVEQRRANRQVFPEP